MSTVLIAALGTRGDVVPFTGVGNRLQRAGHRVVIAAQDAFRDLVEGAGLEFRHLPGDPETGAQSKAFKQYFEEGHNHRTVKALLPEMVESLRQVGRPLIDAARDADVILSGIGAVGLAYHVGLGLGIPTAGTFLSPGAPTGDFPPPALPMRSLGRWGNRLVYRAVDLGERIFLNSVNEIRHELGLPSVKAGATRREQNQRQWPILHGFSEHVVPRPRDWRPGLDVTGYWFPRLQTEWEPPEQLRDFLADGPPPVYFGYGSGSSNQGGRLAELTQEIARKAGVRAVVSGLEVDGDDMIGVGHVDFDWLFPQMAALVHHGGAGTTALGLWSGTPAVTVPLFVDQHFWGPRLVKLGASPDSIRYQKLDVDRLATAIRRAIDDPSYRARTRQLSEQIQDEDGCGPVVKLVDRLASARAVR